eukprot:CAMPEP_0119078730 /NCGR_PEP_ID=MMETSP1178-20130426/102586_1 /TAXON_ID=33656 /ORGANISM="unid sp, Strain CCMP2000" /LENGTH=62 /DNA_ID=CAMNT_0007061193 /DNA_START=1 /DNA_END=189 /DNA_ORIENTATION=+
MDQLTAYRQRVQRARSGNMSIGNPVHPPIALDFLDQLTAYRQRMQRARSGNMVTHEDELVRI